MNMPHSIVFDHITWSLRYLNFCNIETTLMYGARNLEMSIRFSLKSRPSERFHRPEMSQIKAEISLRTNVKLNFHKNVGCQWYQWIPDFYNIRFWANLFNGKKADLSFNLRHFWPMKLFRRPRLYRKTDCHFKISGTVHRNTACKMTPSFSVRHRQKFR